MTPAPRTLGGRSTVLLVSHISRTAKIVKVLFSLTDFLKVSLFVIDP